MDEFLENLKEIIHIDMYMKSSLNRSRWKTQGQTQRLKDKLDNVSMQKIWTGGNLVLARDLPGVLLSQGLSSSASVALSCSPPSLVAATTHGCRPSIRALTQNNTHKSNTKVDLPLVNQLSTASIVTCRTTQDEIIIYAQKHKHNTLMVQSYLEVGVGRELLSSVLGQALVQWDRVGEQNNEVLAVEASLACLSQALVSQGIREHLAAYWSADKRNSQICRTRLKMMNITCGDGCLLICLCGEVVALGGGG